jgi:hypothetical protein
MASILTQKEIDELLSVFDDDNNLDRLKKDVECILNNECHLLETILLTKIVSKIKNTCNYDNLDFSIDLNFNRNIESIWFKVKEFDIVIDKNFLKRIFKDTFLYENENDNELIEFFQDFLSDIFENNRPNSIQPLGEVNKIYNNLNLVVYKFDNDLIIAIKFNSNSEDKSVYKSVIKEQLKLINNLTNNLLNRDG